jgi:spore germination protein D
MKKYSFLKIIGMLLFILMLSGCATQGGSSEQQVDYEETKKMVVDILKTDDGKKALQEAMKDEEMKQTLIMDQKIITDTIQSSLTSEKGTKLIQKAFEDPKFIESYAKNMQSEHEKLIKDLMKDPEYQKMLLGVFQDPEMQKTMQTSIKSQEFRKHLQDVITETLSSPLYKAKIEQALLKAAQEAGQEKSGGQTAQKESGGGGGGGDQETSSKK